MTDDDPSANEPHWHAPGGEGALVLSLGYPMNLRERPIRVGVRLELTGYQCVDHSFYERWGASTMDRVLSNLVDNPDCFLVYDFYVEGVVPAWRHWIDVPLRRRSARTSTVPALPSRETDAQGYGMLFQLRNRPLSYRTSRLMLMTGGATPESALRSWCDLASAVRQDLKNSTAKAKE